MISLILVTVFATHDVDASRPDGSAAAGFLGVALEPDPERPTVHSVLDDSPAAKAGVKKGDVITKVDGKDAGTLDEFLTGMKKRTPGDEVTLTLTRGQDTVEVKVKLTDRPKRLK